MLQLLADVNLIYALVGKLFGRFYFLFKYLLSSIVIVSQHVLGASVLNHLGAVGQLS